jgi:hypothetical protein
MLELPASRPAALTELRRLADGGVRGALAPLARQGDPQARSALRKELSARGPETRLAAGRDLLGAGASLDTAPLLADDDPHVRTSFACSVQLQAR